MIALYIFIGFLVLHGLVGKPWMYLKKSCYSCQHHEIQNVYHPTIDVTRHGRWIGYNCRCLRTSCHKETHKPCPVYAKSKHPIREAVLIFFGPILLVIAVGVAFSLIIGIAFIIGLLFK